MSDINLQNEELLIVLKNLIMRFEYELVEFKEATNDYDKNKIGQYFSAISNEANLKGQQYGWLIFGVRNKDKAIVGTNYRKNSGIENLKHEIAQGTTGSITFIDIYEIYPEYEGVKNCIFYRGTTYDDILHDYKSAEIEFRDYIHKYPQDSVSAILKDYLVNGLGKSPDEIAADILKKNK